MGHRGQHLQAAHLDAAMAVPHRHGLGQAPERVGEADVAQQVFAKEQFEGFAEKMKDPRWVPDFGPARPHPTAGVVAVGARPFLIAYNINLDCDDVELAIARVREELGWMPNIPLEQTLDGIVLLTPLPPGVTAPDQAAPELD